jgi:CMP-N-acetylneuraminic acid synthetase
MALRVIGIVTARGGSKGVPRKNIRPLHGKPLLQYAAESALRATRLARVLLSTEDDEIAEVGRRCGLEVPFMRPAALAQDDTPTLPVIQHAIAWLEQAGDHMDAISILQPTNPLRRAEDIDACIELLEESGADAVFTMLPVPPDFNPHWVYFQEADGSLRISTGRRQPIPRRQGLPPAFRREGTVYVVRRDVVMEQDSLYGDRVVGHLFDAARAVNIDTWEDWRRAEALLAAEDSR